MTGGSTGRVAHEQERSDHCGQHRHAESGHHDASTEPGVAERWHSDVDGGALQMNGGTLTNNGSFTATSGGTLNCYGTGGLNSFDNVGHSPSRAAGRRSFS